MSEIWALGVPAGERVVRTVVVYAALALLLRVAGKRNLAQLNSFGRPVLTGAFRPGQAGDEAPPSTEDRRP
jgi:hypothetical protein